jgi:hypothetical protein
MGPRRNTEKGKHERAMEAKAISLPAGAPTSHRFGLFAFSLFHFLDPTGF